jgi:hypothetical protein
MGTVGCIFNGQPPHHIIEEIGSGKVEVPDE